MSPPDERHRAWQMARAVLGGAAVGSLLCIGNLWLGLKTGLWDSGHLTAALLVFSGGALLGRGDAKRDALAVALATAIGAAPSAAGLIGPIPAMAMLGLPVTGWAALAWGAVPGSLGVLFAAALRRRLVEEEALPFPTGAATAGLLTALHAGAEGSWTRARWLALPAAASGAITALRDGAQLLPGYASPLLAGVGALIGLRTGLSLLGGALLATALGARLLARAGLVPPGDAAAAAAWVSWPAVALLVGASAAALWRSRRSFAGALRDLLAVRSAGKAALAGALGLAALSIALAAWIYGLAPPWALLALALSTLLCTVCARSAGQADISPAGQVSQLSQALLGGALRLPAAADVGAGALVAGPASQVGTSLWSLAAAHRLGAAPQPIALAALAGAAAGSFLSLPAYRLLVAAHPIGSAELPAPSAVQWKALAAVAAQGAAALPAGALPAVVAALVAGAALELLFATRAQRYLPVPVALGLGALLPIAATAAIALGAVLASFRAARGDEAGERAAAVGAGCIAGESVVGTLVALAQAAGFF